MKRSDKGNNPIAVIFVELTAVCKQDGAPKSGPSQNWHWVGHKQTGFGRKLFKVLGAPGYGYGPNGLERRTKKCAGNIAKDVALRNLIVRRAVPLRHWRD